MSLPLKPNANLKSVISELNALAVRLESGVGGHKERLENLEELTHAIVEEAERDRERLRLLEEKVAGLTPCPDDGDGTPTPPTPPPPGPGDPPIPPPDPDPPPDVPPPPDSPILLASGSSLVFAMVEGGVGSAVQSVTLFQGTSASLETPVVTGTVDPDSIIDSVVVIPNGVQQWSLLVDLEDGLGDGSYTASITVASPNQTNPALVIDVTFVVSAVALPILAVSSSALSFSSIEGGAVPPVQVVVVTNSGTGLLDTPTVSSITDPDDIIDTVIVTSAGSQVWNVTVTPKNTVAGTYTASFELDSPNNTGGPVTVDVSLNVDAVVVPLLMHLSSNNLVYNGIFGGGDPSVQTVGITKTGTGSIALPAAVELSDVSNIITSLAVNVIAAQQWELVVTTALGALVAGSYNATIRVTSVGATNSPQDINVTLNIAATVSGVSTTVYATKLGAGSGTTLVHGGFLLPPGRVLPTELVKVRLLDSSNNEVPIFVSAKDQKLHLSGHLRQIELQYERSLTFSSPETLTLVTGGINRNTALDRSEVVYTRDENPPFGSYKNSHPSGMTNASKEYLSSCETFEPFPLWYQGKTPVASYDNKYFTDFDTFQETFWNNWSGAVGLSLDNQYDISFTYIQMWRMTGNSLYFTRACCIGVHFREEWSERSTSGPYKLSSVRWESLYLLALYWLTGEVEMKTALVAQANTESCWYALQSLSGGNIDNYDAEARPWGRKLINCICCILIVDTSRDWQAITEEAIDEDFAGNGWILSGALVGGYWNRVAFLPCTTPNQTVQNFMLSMKLDALDYHIQHVGTRNIAIASKVAGAIAYLENTQWRSGDSPTQSYNYLANNLCPLNGGPDMSVDLNGIHAAALGTAGGRHGNAAWKAKAEYLLESITFEPHNGTDGPFIHSAKQFKEAFGRSWLVLARCR